MPDVRLLRQSPCCTKRPQHRRLSSPESEPEPGEPEPGLCAEGSILDKRAELSRGCGGGGQDGRAVTVIAGASAKSTEEEERGRKVYF